MHEAFGRKLLGKHRARGVTEQHRHRLDALQKGLELIQIVCDADAHESGAVLVGVEPVADQVRRGAGSSQIPRTRP
jgi:hypothetical protein